MYEKEAPCAWRLKGFSSLDRIIITYPVQNYKERMGGNIWQNR
ncbi:hypothetical protein [Enterocloster clostridioformis]|nr:MAG TPA: hypothetical protein [Caudoviricetes sp.]